MQGLGEFWQRYWGCRRGSTATEFSLIAFVLFILIFGLIEFAMIFFVDVLLEGSMLKASRFGHTGYAPAGISREDRIRQIIDKETLGFVDVGSPSFKFDTLLYPSFEQIGVAEPFNDLPPLGNENGVYDFGEEFTDINGSGQWDADMGLSSSGGPGDVILYTVSYDWQLWTFLAPLIGHDGGKWRLSASVAVRNEPWESP